MNNTEKALIKLLSAAIRGREFTDLNINHDINWQKVYNEAEAHAVLPLIYPIVKKISKSHEIDNELMAKWSKYTIMSGVYQTQHINQMKTVFRAFNEAGIPVVALKGLIIRELYPQPELRTMSDSDLLIKEEHIEVAEKVLTSLGYSKLDSIRHESCFIHNSALSIDLHWSVTNKDNLRNVDPFEYTVWQNLRTHDFYGVKIQVLSLEYELMHLFIHIASHIISSGFGIRLLCDIVVFIEQEWDNIDWNLVYCLAEACKLNKLISTILNLCHDLFSLDIPAAYTKVYPGTNEYKKILTNEIFNSGIYGKRNDIRIANTRMLNNVLQSNADVGRFKLVVRYLFPTPTRLDKRYSYASKYPFLLVFAWIHRFAFELFSNGINRLKELFKIGSTSSFVKSRFDLIKWLQL
ncbi:MAG: nucleotidyltransferase family protein [Clostridiaceae bacterium]